MEAAHDCEAHFDASLIHESTPIPADSATSAMTTNSLNIPPRMLCTAMMDMPNEILREIFISVDGEFSKTLWSLSLTCKHFRDIVEEHCEPEYNVRGKWIEDPYALMERLRDQPRLTRLIRVLRMDCDSAKHTKHTEEEVRALVTSLGIIPFRMTDDINLQTWDTIDILTQDSGIAAWLTPLLPQVETIELSILEGDPEPHWDPFIGLLNELSYENSSLSHRFDKLRNLTLLCPTHLAGYMSERHFEIEIRILELPSLKTLRLDNMFCNPQQFKSLSLVTELRIQALQERFRWFDRTPEWNIFHGLESLHLYLQHPEEFYYTEHQAPSSYVDSLDSQAHSLEDLQLYSNEPYCSSHGVPIPMFGDCPCQPTLKHFRKLSSLALTDMSLVGIFSNGPAHWNQPIEDTLKHLAGMFPPSLEAFTHLLWDGPSWFADAQSKEHQEVYSWGNIWKASTRDMFPSLKMVMTQKYGLDGLAEEREVIWQRED